MHSRLSQDMHTNNIPVTEQYGFKKDAAFRLTDSVCKYINQKHMVEEFSVIWHRLMIA